MSLISNGVEELDDELSEAGLCFWNEVYSETTLTNIEFSGTNYDAENVTETVDYFLDGNGISFTNGDDPIGVIELLFSTLKYRDTYTENGVDYNDVYTFTRQ